MTDQFKRTSTILSEVAEGSPERRESQEPQSPLQTTTVPSIRPNADIAPKAETGQVLAVRSEAEGRDDHDSQDADRITEDTRPMPESIHNTTSTRAPSVFIVEDTTELAEVISATLERMNMRIATETHGGKALARYSEIDPDVILLDIGLPDITGWQFLEGIKETRKDTDKMPIVIVITAYGDPANRLVGKLQGVHDYLIKPFTADEVEKVVQRALSSKAL
jgi:CheY-like chemotaxis protein